MNDYDIDPDEEIDLARIARFWECDIDDLTYNHIHGYEDAQAEMDEEDWWERYR